MNVYDTLANLGTWCQVQEYAQTYKHSKKHEYALGYATSLAIYGKYACVSYHSKAIFVVWNNNDREFLPYPSKTTLARLRALGIPLNMKNYKVVFSKSPTASIPLIADKETWYTLSASGQLGLK